MGSLLMQIQARKGYMKLTWQDLADRVHKDISTCQKQLSLTSNPSIATLEEYAEAMDAEIVLMSGDALYDYQNSGVPRAQKNLADMDRELEHLKEKLDTKDVEIADHRETIRILREQCERLTHIVMMKDERIDKLTDKLMEM